MVGGGWRACRARPGGVSVATGARRELRACTCRLRSSWLRCREDGRSICYHSGPARASVTFPVRFRWIRKREESSSSSLFDRGRKWERKKERKRSRARRRTSQHVQRPDESGVQLDGQEARERQRDDSRRAQTDVPGCRDQRGSREEEQHQVTSGFCPAITCNSGRGGRGSRSSANSAVVFADSVVTRHRTPAIHHDASCVARELRRESIVLAILQIPLCGSPLPPLPTAAKNSKLDFRVLREKSILAVGILRINRVAVHFRAASLELTDRSLNSSGKLISVIFSFVPFERVCSKN